MVNFLKFKVGVVSAALIFFCGSPVSAAPLFKEGVPSTVGKALDEQMPHFSGLVKDLSRAVVNISVEAGITLQQVQGEGEEAPPPPANPFPRKEPELPYRSLGSGFILSEDGYIVTNNHVIDNSDTIIVRLLDDKTEYSAALIGKDPKTDLALIKIEPKTKLNTVFLGDSDAVEVGEWVIAIGNQFQLGQTVTAGIVSAKSRKLPYQMTGPYDSFIQTDASINPGSSGGPLFNTRGQVIGINTAIFSPGRQQFGSPGFNIGIGFSIPINLVKGVVQQIKDKGKVTRGVLGVLIQPIDGDTAQALGLSSPNGALVADVLRGSPAAKAGFERKDVIVSYNGQNIIDHDNLPLMVANTAIGSEVQIGVLRGKEHLTIKAVIEELKEPAAEKPKEKEKSNKIGIVVEKLPDDIAQGLPAPVANGLIIKNVDADSGGDRAGMSKGDILLEFAGKAVTSVAELDQAIAGLKKGVPVLVVVQKKEGTRILTLKLKNGSKAD